MLAELSSTEIRCLSAPGLTLSRPCSQAVDVLRHHAWLLCNDSSFLLIGSPDALRFLGTIQSVPTATFDLHISITESSPGEFALVMRQGVLHVGTESFNGQLVDGHFAKLYIKLNKILASVSWSTWMRSFKLRRICPAQGG